MEITNHTTPTTAIGIAYFLPNATFVAGTITPQKNTAAAICGSPNAMPIPHNNKRTTMMFFLIKLFMKELYRMPTQQEPVMDTCDKPLNKKEFL